MPTPLSYRQVLEQYDRAKAFGYGKTLPEFAQAMDEATQSPGLFGAAKQDGTWTRFSTRLDQGIESSPLGQLAGDAMAGVFGEQGRDVGVKLPRALLNSAPAYLAGPEAGVPATIGALGLT